MEISSFTQLVEAATLLQRNELEVSDISFADTIVETIFINSEDWVYTDTLDYRIASLITATQKDFLNVYNKILGTNINLQSLAKDVASYEHLVLKFKVEEGSIEWSKILNSKSLIKFLDMSTKEKCITALLVAGVVLAFTVPSNLADILNALKDENPVEYKEVKETVAKSQKAKEIIINNLGDGYVVYNDNVYTGDDIQRNLIEKDPLDKDNIEPITISDNFIITQYNFKKHEVTLYHSAYGQLKASTSWLQGEQREVLGDIASEYISNKKSIPITLTLDVKIFKQKVQDALVVKMEGVLDSPLSLEEAMQLKTKEEKDLIATQLRLF